MDAAIQLPTILYGSYRMGGPKRREMDMVLLPIVP